MKFRGRNYELVGGRRPSKSVFDLSYEVLTTCDAKQLIPIAVDEVVPGDVFQYNVESVIRMQPLVAPILHELNVDYHYFFVPYRLLWDGFEDFITGGKDGDDDSEYPTWEPTTAMSDEESLWDYLGFPITATPGTPLDPEGFRPSMFPRSAYYFIYNEYYRDENIIDEVDYKVDEVTEYGIKNRCWSKDMFAAALPWQQRGTSPALPLVGTGYADFSNSFVEQAVSGAPINADTTNETLYAYSGAYYNDEAVVAFNKNVIDLSAIGSIDLNELRLSTQIQRWMELNARGGIRYEEFIYSHFGERPGDSRMQIPEYIGGAKFPLIISEVLQTSEDGATPQGNLAGHGISVGKKFIGKYRVKEFGLIMGIMSIMPKAKYEQGIDRQWYKQTRFDFCFPEFVNLSEQPIYQAELFVTNNSEAENTTIFGYCGRYDEMRVKHDKVTGQFRKDHSASLDYWNASRQFSSAPLLNESFLTSGMRNDMFAVTDEHGFLVNVGNIIKAVRPIPYMSNPGYLDH